jgi:hypothetical protein
MKLRVIALVTGLLAVVSTPIGVGFGTSPASAQSLGAVEICTTNTSPSACINDTAGSTSSGSILQFWENDAEGATNNSWVVNVIGTVKDGEGGEDWPFDEGSELNARYDGDDVLQFNLTKNTNYCAAQQYFEAENQEGPLVLSTCQSSVYQDFVLSDYDGSFYIIAVGASNELYTYTDHIPDLPVWIAPCPDGGTANGDYVCMQPYAVLTWEFAS